MDISDILIAAICVVALFQPTKQRFLIAAAFAITCAAHAMFSGCLSDVDYYVSAGVADVVVIFIIAVFAKVSRFAELMGVVCITSLFLNLCGLVLITENMEPGSYNAAFAVLYFAVLLIFIKRGKDEGYWYDGVCFPYLKCNNLYNSLHRKAKP